MGKKVKVEVKRLRLRDNSKRHQRQLAMMIADGWVVQVQKAEQTWFGQNQGWTRYTLTRTMP